MWEGGWEGAENLVESCALEGEGDSGGHLLWNGTYLPKGIYGAWLLFFDSARTNKRHHHRYDEPRLVWTSLW